MSTLPPVVDDCDADAILRASPTDVLKRIRTSKNHRFGAWEPKTSASAGA